MLRDCLCNHRGHKQKHSDWDAYSRSKLLDLMAAQELNRRLYGAPSPQLASIAPSA